MVVRQKASNEMAFVPMKVVGKGKQLRLHVPDSDKVVQDHLMQFQAFGRPKRMESMVECGSGGPRQMICHLVLQGAANRMQLSLKAVSAQNSST